jgi:hypothetical protein
MLRTHLSLVVNKDCSQSPRHFCRPCVLAIVTLKEVATADIDLCQRTTDLPLPILIWEQSRYIGNCSVNVQLSGIWQSPRIENVMFLNFETIWYLFSYFYQQLLNCVLAWKRIRSTSSFSFLIPLLSPHDSSVQITAYDLSSD